MGKLVAVVGNTGVGKTTFVNAICQNSNFIPGIEKHEHRPFQELFTQNHKKYALANQLDYLLLRADQEIKIRSSNLTGIQDGGLDQDFQVFTRLFYEKNYLTEDEFFICQRQYGLIREFLPPPEIIVWLKASPDVIADRYQLRNRRLSIAQIEDIEKIDNLLNDWLGGLASENLITVDSESEDRQYSKSIQKIIRTLNSKVSILSKGKLD
ncbi:MAG: deoxynucleoside kinase [Anaerolineales bacterium]|nr:deoxynucleoside kinase [Anaerolineales bacterium]